MNIYIVNYTVMDGIEGKFYERKFILVEADSPYLALQKFRTIKEIVDDRDYCKSCKPEAIRARIYR